MARKIIVQCDIPGCEETTVQDERAGTLTGWLRREVKDGFKRELATGVHDFDARVVFHICPKHCESAEKLASPPTHPEVLAFKHQPDKGDGSGRP